MVTYKRYKVEQLPLSLEKEATNIYPSFIHYFNFANENEKTLMKINQFQKYYCC